MSCLINEKTGKYKCFLGKLLILTIVSLYSFNIGAHEAHADWESGYSYRKSVTIDNTKVSGSADHTNFPVLINKTDTDLRTTGNGGHVQNANGYDIIFTASDGTTNLDFEVEKYVATTGEFVAWVRIPTLDYNDDTIIYIYYGNSGISTSQENVTGVWNSNYKGVWHLKEDPSGGAPQMDDSTSNGNHMTSSGTMTSGDQVAGKIDGSLDLDGTDDYISRSYDTDFNFGTGSFTTSGWFKTAGSPGGGATSTDVSVTASSDDGHESPAGSVNLSYYRLDVGAYHVGTRFLNVNIPANATITNAYVTYYAKSGSSTATSTTIYAEDSATPATYTTASYNISSRTKTSASVPWSPGTWVTGNTYNSPDISSVIQELVDTYSGVTNISILTDIGTGKREAVDYNNPDYPGPALHVEYSTGTQFVTSRYDDQGFKTWLKGSGEFVFGIDDDSDWGPDIEIESSGTYDDDTWHQFTAVKSSNDAIYLYIDGAQVDSDTSLNASGNVTVSVSQESDDAEEYVSNGAMDLSSSDLELVMEGGTDQEVGMRFQNITIPSGATITNAYVQFKVDETSSGTTNLTVYGEDTDNSSTFTSSTHNITGRTKTSASVAWNSVPAWNTVGEAGVDQRTPNISSVIQEVIDRVGWSSGNAVSIIIDGTGTRVAESYAGGAPQLVVDYTVQLSTLTSNSAPLTFGSDEPANASYFDGIIDEARISNTARSADWIQTSYNNQNSPSTFYTFGTEEAADATLKEFIISGGVKAKIIINGLKQKLYDN